MFRIEVIGDERIVAAMSNSQGRQAVMRQHLELEVAMLQRAVVPLTPAFRGILRGSWATEVMVLGATFAGVIGSPLVYAPVIEHGRSPGAAPPPADAIASWVASKMGSDVSPFAVARSIGAKGIKKTEMLLHAQQITLPARIGLRSTLLQRMMAVS